MTLAVVLIAAYLIGSIPTSYLVVYRVTGRDIRSIGSGNPGAMNVLDSVGVMPALIVGVGDIVKGMAAVSVAYFAGAGDSVAVAAALVAVAGHDYSVFLRLHGGNGMATMVGGMAALLPIETFIGASLAVSIWFVLRSLPIVGAIGLPAVPRLDSWSDARSRRIAGLIGLASVPALAYWFDAPEVKLIGVVLLLTLTALKIWRFEGFHPARSRSDR